MIKKYSDFCYNQVGSYVLDYIDYFEGLRPQLTRADIQVSLPEYVSAMILSSMFSTVISAIILIQIFLLSYGLIGIFIGTGAAIILGSLTLIGFYIYPSLRIRDRASKMEDQLPFGVLYISTLAGTGTSVSEIFKNLAEADEYNELSVEAEKIHRDIEHFGMDISKALEEGAKRSPSEEWSELLWGLNHVITIGGSLRDFLGERASILMDEYERKIEEFSSELSLIVEVYIILVIFGSIIFTSMSVVMSSFSNIDPNAIVAIQALSAFIGLPFISLFLIVVVEGLTPGGIE